MIRALTMGWLAALAWASGSRADLVYFARGGEAQLDATIDGSTVRLDTPDGPKSFPRDAFRAIVPDHRVADDWRMRREAIQDGSVGPTFEAAWWALENGLTPEAVATLRTAQPQAANHPPTARALAMLDALESPASDPDLAPLRRRLGPSTFRELRGPRVVLLHQSDEADARARLDVLERVVTTYYLGFSAQGLILPIPRERLVSVWFARRADYVAFLRRSEAAAFADTQGYYHPVLGVVFAFDTRSGEAQLAGRRAVANLRRDGAPAAEVDRRALLLDLDWRAQDLGIAAHETVHQLVDASALAPRSHDFPLWLHEGLAAQYEVVRGGRWAGVGRSHDLRLPDWRSIHPAPRLAPLIRDSALQSGYDRDAYAESWALVHFLRKTRPREFLTFLDLLRLPPPTDHPPADRAEAAFGAAFGPDLAGLESAWRRHVAGLTTPLEADRPSGGESRLVGPDLAP